MAKAKKLLKAQKPSALDKVKKAKRTGYRFKTEGIPALHKKDGSLNEKGKKLYYKTPTKAEIEKYKKHSDGSYDSKTMEIYHERRADRKHSDDSSSKKYKKGGKIKQNPAQSTSYKRSADAQIKAKPTGYRYTDKLAKRLGVSATAVPTKAHIEKYLGKGVYDEKRKDKSDIKPSMKLAKGGSLDNPDDLDKFWANPKNSDKTIYFVEEDGDYPDNSEYPYMIGVQTKEDFEDNRYWDIEGSEYDLKDAIKTAKNLAKKNNGVYLDNLRVTRGYKLGGKIKQGAPQSEHYSRKADAQEKAKPTGHRYTDKLAKKLHKSPTAVPTKKDVEQYLGDGVYNEKRKDKSDIKPSAKLEEGGAIVEMSQEEMKAKLGREPRYPYDFIEGKKWVKCFMRPYYALKG